MRRVAEEFRNLPLRIRAILSEQHRHSRVRLQSPYPPGYGREILVQSIGSYALAASTSDSYRVKTIGLDFWISE
jgi:hypothetical protein